MYIEMLTSLSFMKIFVKNNLQCRIKLHVSYVNKPKFYFLLICKKVFGQEYLPFHLFLCKYDILTAGSVACLESPHFLINIAECD